MTKEVTEEQRKAAAKEGPGSPEHDLVTKADEAAAAAEKEAEAKKKGVGAADDKKKELPEGDLTLDEEKKKPEPEAIEEIKATGNKVVDDVAKLLADKNIPNADKVIAEFAENGELSLTSQAALVDGLGESVAGLVLKQLNDEATSLKEKGNAERNELLEYTNKKFNGEDAELTWTQMTEFARSPEAGLSEQDVATMNAMLKKGGLQGKLVVDKIAQIYFANNGTTSEADLLLGDTYQAGATFTPISRTEYTQKLRAAVREFGENSIQVEQLNRRREQSIAAGH